MLQKMLLSCWLGKETGMGTRQAHEESLCLTDHEKDWC